MSAALSMSAESLSSAHRRFEAALPAMDRTCRWDATVVGRPFMTTARGSTRPRPRLRPGPAYRVFLSMRNSRAPVTAISAPWCPETPRAVSLKSRKSPDEGAPADLLRLSGPRRVRLPGALTASSPTGSPRELRGTGGWATRHPGASPRRVRSASRPDSGPLGVFNPVRLVGLFRFFRTFVGRPRADAAPDPRASLHPDHPVAFVRFAAAPDAGRTYFPPSHTPRPGSEPAR